MRTTDNLIEVIISTEISSEFKRLDVFLNDYLNQQGLSVSRTEIKSLFEKGLITSETEKLSLKKIPKVETKISITIPAIAETELIAQNIDIQILYEDKDLVIVNKHQGLVVHPAPGHPDGTLVNAILYHCPDIEGVGDEKRPGIVHRLDRGTSGVMVIAKNTKCHRLLVEMFSHHDLERRYNALTIGKEPPVGGTLKSMIGRHPNHRIKMSTRTKSNPKEAITHYNLMASRDNIHLVECKLETGRTHQIRVHLTELLNLPLIGDELYGNVKTQKNLLPEALKSISLEYPYLHAKLLAFDHPITKEHLKFETPPPSRFQDIIDFIESK